MKIAVWSPSVFAGRKSTNLLFMALQAIKEEDAEQLIIHADPEGSGPEHFLLSGCHRRRMMTEKEFGVDYLASLLQCERFSKEQVINASYTFANGKLHVLSSGEQGFYARNAGNAIEAISRIMLSSCNVFRNVWIELPAGKTVLGERILSEADAVIVNLAQSPFETEKWKSIRQLKNVFYLVGAYEQRNTFTVHNLELLYPQLRGRCGGIPYCSELLSACCSGEAEDFWVRRTGQREMKEASAFLYAVEKAYAGWKARCGIKRCE